jgi:ssDNA-binding Zn-finger/Zn-ribbon topoisomerase 1
MHPEPDSPWRDDGVTTAASCAACGTVFDRRGRGRFCSPACRQAAWRWRGTAELAAPPKAHPKLAVIYECTSCEARFVGDRRCPDCNRWNRRVDLGGSCPHCDEPVAINDLTEGR